MTGRGKGEGEGKECLNGRRGRSDGGGNLRHGFRGMADFRNSFTFIISRKVSIRGHW